MERPKGITALAILQVILAVTTLLLLLPALSRIPAFELFGTPVSPETFGWWSVLGALAMLYFAHAFWHGVAVGFYLYVALKPAGWVVTLAQGPGTLELSLLLVDVAILAYVVKNRAWFRN